jgi:hypothetical protein
MMHLLQRDEPKRADIHRRMVVVVVADPLCYSEAPQMP